MKVHRLNYGTVSALDIFDKAMDDKIDELRMVLHIRDDFIVHGHNDTEHDEALESLPQRFRKYGLTFNPKKCKLRVPEIDFFRNILFGEGVKPSPDKAEGLKKMDHPKNAPKVRSLLEWLNIHVTRLLKMSHGNGAARSRSHSIP